MRKKIDIKSMLLGALLATGIVISIAAAEDGRTVWEYRIIKGTVLGGQGPQDTGNLDNRITSHVAQGWQFVTASGVGDASGFAVMRREKSERN
jgi:hypothetical protein